MKKPNLSTKFISALIIFTFICTGNVYSLNYNDTLRKPIGSDALARQKDMQGLTAPAAIMSQSLETLAKLGQIDIVLFDSKEEGKSLLIWRFIEVEEEESLIDIFNENRTERSLPSGSHNIKGVLFSERARGFEKLVSNFLAGLQKLTEMVEPYNFGYYFHINKGESQDSINTKIAQVLEAADIALSTASSAIDDPILTLREKILGLTIQRDHSQGMLDSHINDQSYMQKYSSSDRKEIAQLNIGIADLTTQLEDLKTKAAIGPALASGAARIAPSITVTTGL